MRSPSEPENHRFTDRRPPRKPRQAQFRQVAADVWKGPFRFGLGRRLALCLLVLGIAGFAGRAGAEEAGGPGGSIESADLQLQVKAAFLPKLAAFVEWPAGVFPRRETPIVLGIIGTDPFGPEFEAALRLQNAKGRPFLLRRFRDPAELTECQMLFVCSSEKARWREIFAALKDRPTLTIGDGDQFIEAGGMVNFVKEDGRIRFQINTDASERAGLRISAKLLQVSRVYRDAKWSK